MATIQLEKPQREWSFACWAHGEIWTKHRIRADSAEEASRIHDGKFKEHKFVSAIELYHRRRRCKSE